MIETALRLPSLHSVGLHLLTLGNGYAAYYSAYIGKAAMVVLLSLCWSTFISVIFFLSLLWIFELLIVLLIELPFNHFQQIFQIQRKIIVSPKLISLRQQHFENMLLTVLLIVMMTAAPPTELPVLVGPCI